VDGERGVLISSTNMPNWRDVPIASTLRKHLGLPVKVQRSIHLAALYEKWSNPQAHDRTILIVSVRTGIGMSLMYRGELYTGQNGFEGEIGHTVVDLEGPACECGNRGCLETYVSAAAICALAHVKIDAGECAALRALIESGEHLRPELIYPLARDGDSDCAEIVRHVGRYLGIAVANMINLLAPDEVVVCGSIDHAGELLLESMRGQVERSALRRSRQGVVLRLAREQEKLPLLGAAVLIAQELFQLPRLSHGTFDVPRQAGTGRALRKVANALD
jgi:glucokinase